MSSALVGFTLPKTRRVVWRLIRHHKFVALQLMLFVVWWVLIWPALRGVMDDLGAPRHGAGLDERVFGGLPTIWLQELYNRWHGLAWASVAIHGSWFVVPWLAVAGVMAREPKRVPSLLRWWFTLLVICLPFFALFPVKPPWMASSAVIRVNSTIVGAIDDPNPFAAMPSLHVALPLLISFWFLREQWRLPGIAMLGYSGLVAFEVVFSGEHYVADVVGAVAAAGAVAMGAKLNYRGVLSWTRSRARAIGIGGRRLPAPALASRVRLHHRERAQSLIEFAFIAPIMFLLLFVIVDFAIGVDRRLVLQHAVREGARVGAVGAGVPTVIFDAQQEGQDVPATYTVCYVNKNATPYPGDVGDAVKVQADYDWNYPLASEIAHVFHVTLPPLHMSPSGTGRLEQSVPGATPCATP